MSDELSNIGHNTEAGRQLNAAVQKIETLEAQKADIAGDIKDEYEMLKGQGFETKIVRKIVRLRKQDKAKRDDEAAKTELYLHALGML